MLKRNMILNNELGMMCKEAILASFKIPFRQIPERTEENYENITQDT